MSDLRVREAGVEDAAAVRDVIHQAFGARPQLQPPSTAALETTESVAAALARDGGLLCHVDDVPAGALLFAAAGPMLGLRRVSAVPRFQSRGVASAVVGVAEEVAAGRGYDDVRLLARAELPATLTFWQRRGYRETYREGTQVTLAKSLPLEAALVTASDTRHLGERIGGLVTAGDVVLLSGELGAGKTTLTQGIGAGMQVRGEVTSPTFVISRVHPSEIGGPALVHVDAYRLGNDAELDDLDLDAYVEESVTVVEWGSGIADALAADQLRVTLSRARGGGDVDDETRVATVTPVGVRWVGTGVRSALLGVPARLT